MDTRPFGRTGLMVSRIGLGCMTFGSPAWRPWCLTPDESARLIASAVEAGITLFDTADVYSDGGSEQILGTTLRSLGVRDRCIVATKIGLPMSGGADPGGLQPHRIVHAVESSLRRLGDDCIDLLQLHRLDPNTPLEVVVESLDQLVSAGKVRHIGSSTMHAWEFATALTSARLNGQARFESMQVQVNLLYREEEREMLPLCRAEGVAVLAWSPLARGLLARTEGPPSLRSQTDDLARRMYYRTGDDDVLNATRSVARERGIQPAQVALSWLLDHPGVTAPIVGVRTETQLEQAINSLTIRLNAEERRRLEAPYLPHFVEWGDSRGSSRSSA